MRGVDAAFERLQPVALLPDLGDVAVGLWHLRPLEGRGCGHLVARPHIGPDHAAHLDGRIGGQPDLVAERLGLVHLVDAVAVDVEFPAVIDAAQPALLRCARTRARRGGAGKTRP